MPRTSTNPEKTKAFFAHKSACIDPGAIIGSESRIWHYCHISNKAHIGNGTVLGQNVYVGPGVEIGSNVHIQNNVSVYQGVILEDHVFCGPSVVFTNSLTPRSEFIRKDNHCFVKTVIRRGATLGANCTIVCGVEIGQYAIVGAGAVVTKNVPDFAVVIGVPAQLQGWACRCGARLPLTLDPYSDESAACSVCQRNFIKTGYMIRDT